MATIQARLRALEVAIKVKLIPLFLFVDKDNITIEQQREIDEARMTGRQVKLISWLEAS